MASRTKYLGLKLNDKMSSDLVFNFQKLDSLGALYQTDSQDNAVIRSAEDVKIEPGSPDLGGSGGGSVTFGTADTPAATITFHTDSLERA
jgi:hypothetical protein